MTSTLGYARVSTAGQDLNAQHDALHAAGVAADRMYTDTLSGATGTHRPGLAALLDYARDGDTVIVTAIDRLGRSVADVTRTIAGSRPPWNPVARLTRRHRHRYPHRTRDSTLLQSAPRAPKFRQRRSARTVDAG